MNFLRSLLATRLRSRLQSPAAPESPTRRSLMVAGLSFPILGLASVRAIAAGGIEQFWKYNTKPEDYLATVFSGQVPAPQVTDTAGKSGDLLQALPQRLRYWRSGGRTVWIFDEIGKAGYAPTTCGFVIKAGAIESASVLVYRESRGEQVGTASFLQQLVGARPAGASIDKNVDNVSGATYSVNMMKRMARVALALDASVPA